MTRKLISFLLASIMVIAVPSQASDYEWAEGQVWSLSPGRVEETAQKQLQKATQLEKQNKYLEASSQYFLVVKEFPRSREASIALARLSKLLYEMENYYPSFKALEQIAKDYPNTMEKRDVIDIEFRIAQELRNGAPASLVDTSKKRSLLAAIEVYDAILEHDPNGPRAAEAWLGKGDCYTDAELKEYRAGLIAYSKVVDEFPNSKHTPFARAGLELCNTNLNRGNHIAIAELRNAGIANALNNDERYSDSHLVFEKRVQDVEEAKARQMWETAMQYEKRGNRQSLSAAVFTLEELTRRYPNSTLVPQSIERAEKIKKRLPKNDPVFDSEKFKMPFTKDKKPPTFVAPKPDEKDHVVTAPVLPSNPKDAPKGIAPSIVPHGAKNRSSTIEEVHSSDFNMTHSTSTHNTEFKIYENAAGPFPTMTAHAKDIRNQPPVVQPNVDQPIDRNNNSILEWSRNDNSNLDNARLIEVAGAGVIPNPNRAAHVTTNPAPNIPNEAPFFPEKTNSGGGWIFTDDFGR